MTPQDMDGLAFGPVTHRVDRERIAAFVMATGDSVDRWVGIAPPAYSNTLLFKVAGGFLFDPRLAEHTTTLIHVDQTFTYPEPIYADDEVVITGTVDRVRQRSGSYFVTFVATATAGDRSVMESRSTFLMSDQAAGDPGADQGEPTAEERAATEEPSKRSLPAAGQTDVIPRSASRADLVRYAAVTDDYNPLHWDHDAARAAGLDGVVVHGLLQSAWLTQHAAAFAPGDSPVAAIKARFRNALRPAIAAATSVEVSSVADEGAALSLQLSAEDATIVTAEATIRGVTP